MIKILFRPQKDREEELKIASKYFEVIQNRTLVGKGDLIIGRYSVLPYYKETEQDINILGGRLINTYQQHNFIANFEYYDILKKYTFETWFDHDFYQCEHKGAFVVKGKTNSRKHEWNSLMYAENAKQALTIASELSKDSLIGPQGILYRKYVPLKTYDIGINDIRFTNEWRFFFMNNVLIDYGYYWSTYEMDMDLIPTSMIDKMKDKAKEIAQIAKDYVNFFVIDMAETEDGDVIMVEMNDGQMSGLSEIDIESFYSGLRIHFMGCDPLSKFFDER